MLLIGGSIAAVGTLVLFFAFRAFGDAKARARPVALIAGLVVFVFLCCVALLLVSYAGE